ncbi:hypothetical protein Ade02nite_80560 [Paractinoplanes deccanensis]|uniref:Mechanosensitive ion channel MscS domain-containing protein n=1 Tax=Paractinoplanes deccanensis TaxID=113561 RepID=A0ABQ3YHC4_9ACTN|nr:mechanosensitive ion channel family protein [Actinoplanes deccanensis]GID79415.1 hypothetical protein Ade02nite_80560 [Actinoplanes deccanensis]
MLDPIRMLEQRVRPDFRRTLGYGTVALAALVTGSQFSGTATRDKLITYGCALLVAIFGLFATRTAAREVHRVALARAGDAAATPLRVLVELGGYLITAFSVCDLLDVGLQRLLVGGAITGVVLGLAAQPVLGNLFAGLVLLFARPYVPGTRIRVLSGALNGPLTGTIVSAGLLYTVLETDDGPLNIPNSALMASAVGPSAPYADLDPETATRGDLRP